MTISLLLATFMISDVHATGLEKKLRQHTFQIVFSAVWSWEKRFEISVVLPTKTQRAWNPDGAELLYNGESLSYKPFDSASWLYTTQSLNFRYGLMNRVGCIGTSNLIMSLWKIQHWERILISMVSEIRDLV